MRETGGRNDVLLREWDRGHGADKRIDESRRGLVELIHETRRALWPAGCLRLKSQARKERKKRQGKFELEASARGGREMVSRQARRRPRGERPRSDLDDFVGQTNKRNVGTVGEDDMRVCRHSLGLIDVRVRPVNKSTRCLP